MRVTLLVESPATGSLKVARGFAPNGTFAAPLTGDEDTTWGGIAAGGTSVGAGVAVGTGVGFGVVVGVDVGIGEAVGFGVVVGDALVLGVALGLGVTVWLGVLLGEGVGGGAIGAGDGVGLAVGEAVGAGVEPGTSIRTVAPVAVTPVVVIVAFDAGSVKVCPACSAASRKVVVDGLMSSRCVCLRVVSGPIRTVTPVVTVALELKAS